MSSTRGKRIPRVEKNSDSEDDNSMDTTNDEAADDEASNSNNKTTDSCDEDAWKVLITHKDIGKDNWNNFSAVMLPHPKTQSPALFLLDSRMNEAVNDQNFVYEILTMTEEEGLSSWFIGNHVSSNGNLYIMTPIDPLFLILPAISKSKQAKPFLDHLIEYLPLKPAKIFSRRINPEQLLNIAIKKSSEDIEAYLYDEPKTISWLSKKVKKLAQYFEVKNITRAEASVSTNFNKSLVSDSSSNQEYLLYACDVISEYIDDELKVKLQEALGLPTDAERQKRKNSNEGRDGSKKLKMEGVGDIQVQPLEDYGTPNKIQKSAAKGSTAKQKQLQQAAKGTHSLLKFFSAKPKTG